MSLKLKYARLKDLLKELQTVAVAFSGGVDSTLLLKVASLTLGPDKVLALTAIAPIIPAFEIEQSHNLAKEFGVVHRLIQNEALADPDFVKNSPERCYFCKRAIFSRFLEELKLFGFHTLVDGSNVDDMSDFRPGHKALQELGVRSPLLEAGFTKQDIRDLSRQLELPTWDLQPLACLATRFPYGTPITLDKLEKIEACEAWLRNQGFNNYRVRCHDQLARIEIAADDFPRVLESSLRENLIKIFKANGFDYITLDLQGFRSGSMNEVLSTEETRRSQ